MCGIIGINAVEPFAVREGVRRLQRLEYRGYDSFGLFTGKTLFKQVGEIVDPNINETTSKIILHTRWATHGGVTRQNAHPHQAGKVTIIHNGILSNYQEFKTVFKKQGRTFLGETDSEVIAHYFDEKLKKVDVKQACIDFIKEAKGEFAILMMIQGDDTIYALRRDSPLVLGPSNNQNILASDIYAFSDTLSSAIFFENNEFAFIKADNYTFFDAKGKQLKKEIKTFVWEQEESTKQEYDHYMIKEIKESPKVVNRLLLSLEAEQRDRFKQFIDLIKSKKRIIFTACGTSYHAALLGVYYLHKCGVEAQALIGSEFQHFANVNKDTLVIAVSQSGETMDLIEGLKYAKDHGATIASIVNVPYSTIQRMSAVHLHIAAGQEICVAATKSFINQVTLFLAIAQQFGYTIDLTSMAKRIEHTLTLEPEIKKLAKQIYRHNDLYVLGRGLSYPVAREMALKIKEISYIHAEGMMGGELKHGTIALIEKGTPVIALISNQDHDMVSNAKEVEARGAHVIKITNEMAGDIQVETSNDGKFGILASIVGQLLTYYIALERKLPIDKPRNLAKSVTVK